MRNSRISKLLIGAVLGVTGIGGCTSIPGTLDQTGRETELRLASDVWPPFTDTSTKPRIALELVHTALERAGVRARSDVRTEFADLVTEIRAGRLDGSAALWRSPERESYLLYSRPYLENRLILVGPKSADMTAATLSDLAGKRVALVGSYAYGAAVEGAQGPRLVKGPSDGENLRRLLRGEVDYVLADELLVHHLARRYEEKANRLLEIGTTPLLTRSLHFAIRRDLPDARAIVDRFDAEILAMMTDGSYNRILQLDWIRVDVDGDGVPELVLGGGQAGPSAPERSYDLFAPGAPETTADRESRYIIDGRTYDGWDDVPPRHKTPYEGTGDPQGPEASASRDWGVPLIKF